MIITALAAALLAVPADAACKGENLLARMAAQVPSDYAAVQSSGRSMPFGEGVLFRITRAGLLPSFLFGTLHAVDPRLAALSLTQRNTIRASKRVVLETIDFDGHLSASQAGQDLAAPGPERASRLLAPSAFRDLAALTVHRGFPAALADTIKAPALALMLDLPACAARTKNGLPFLDAQVLVEARRAAIPVVGLETTAEQISIADGLAPAVQSALLSAVLAQSGEAESVVETSVTLYLDRQIGTLLAWTRSARPIAGRAEAGIPAEFFDRILTARTSRMRDRLLPMLDKGGLFIAVGAIHVPGPEGLAALVSKAGYGVEEVE